MKQSVLLPCFLGNESFLGVFPKSSQFNNKSICLYVICNIQIFVLRIFYYVAVPPVGKEWDPGSATLWGERIKNPRALARKMVKDVFGDNSNSNNALHICVSPHISHGVSPSWKLRGVCWEGGVVYFHIVRIWRELDSAELWMNVLEVVGSNATCSKEVENSRHYWFGI